MSFDLTCLCGAKLRIGEEQANQRLGCPKCGNILYAPPAEDEESSLKKKSVSAITWEELGLPEPKPGTLEAVAPNPAKVRVHSWHYFRCYPTGFLIAFFPVLLFATLALLWDWGFWEGVVLTLCLLWQFLVVCCRWLRMSLTPDPSPQHS